MKIAHVVLGFPPFRSGISNSAYHMCWQMGYQGHAVTVFTLRTRSSPIEENYPFTVRRLRPLIHYGNAGFVPQLLWQLQRFDIVHLHYPFFGAAEMIYFLDKFRDFKLIVSYHMDVEGGSGMKKFFDWHSSHVMPRILNSADKIIVSSMDYAESSLIKDRLRIEPDKFVAIPFGVNARIFRPRRKDDALVKKHGLVNKFTILFVGALDQAHYFKGINYLIKALQLIAGDDSYRLLVVGDGNLAHSYRSLASSFGLERKVIFAGEVSDDVLPLYYNLADIFVLPSTDRSEAFGIVVLEAMASGVPVLVSDIPGVRTLVGRNERGLLVKPRRADILAVKIRFLHKYPKVASRFADTALRTVRQQYTWEAVGLQLNEVYASPNL